MTLPAPAPPPWQRWDLHPSVIIGLALLGGLYVYWGGLAPPRRRVASFLGALAVLGLALNGPLHNLSDFYLFSAHMVQHLVLTLVFPPLLLYGTPAWVVRPLLQPRPFESVVCERGRLREIPLRLGGRGLAGLLGLLPRLAQGLTLSPIESVIAPRAHQG